MLEPIEPIAEYMDLQMTRSGRIIQKQTGKLVGIHSSETSPHLTPNTIPLCMYFWNHTWYIATDKCVNAYFHIVQVGEYYFTVGQLCSELHQKTSQLSQDYCYQLLFQMKSETETEIQWVSRYHLQRGIYEPIQPPIQPLQAKL